MKIMLEKCKIIHLSVEIYIFTLYKYDDKS